MINAASFVRFIARSSAMDVGLFCAVIIALYLIARAAEFFATLLVAHYPSQRMGLLAWVPIFIFGLYFAGIIVSFYTIFEPTRELLLGLVATGFIALGFVLKDIVTAIIAGIVVLVDKPFQVGDRVSFQGQYGEIISIGLRSIKLLTLDESVVTIPNQLFLQEIVSSSSAGELGMMTTVDIFVSPENSLAKVKSLVENVSKTNEYIDSGAVLKIVGQNMLAFNGSVIYKMTLKCFLKDARSEKAFQTDVTIAINKSLKDNNVIF